MRENDLAVVYNDIKTGAIIIFDEASAVIGDFETKNEGEPSIARKLRRQVSDGDVIVRKAIDGKKR